MSQAVAAVDLGATSGRVMLARFGSGRITLDTVGRFPNQPVNLPDGLHWNIPALYQHTLTYLGEAISSGTGVTSIGIDSWAIDYGLLRESSLLGLPYHYRDPRGHLGVEHVHAQIPFEDLYRRNGLQFLYFNTLYQLAAESSLLQAADSLALVPDLISYWLTGVTTAERTNASTTGLVNISGGHWDPEILAAVGLRANILPPLIDPGHRVGPLRNDVRDELGISGSGPSVVAVGSHDTASAVLATPLEEPESAFISCGTWGLAGLELPNPILSQAAAAANFTNERAVDGGIRFLTNVMGLWLLSETIRAWRLHDSPDALGSLLKAAAQVGPPTATFDVADPRFVAPGNMAPRIQAWYAERQLRAPDGRVEIVRAIVESLAAALVRAVETAETLANRPAPSIHLVGGGAQNALLCQLIANFAQRPVHAGPVEATAVGNALVQARSAEFITADPAAARDLVRASFPIRTYRPQL